MYECDATAKFDENNLPEGLCDEIYQKLGPCASNIATGWAVGGDDVRQKLVFKRKLQIKKYLYVYNRWSHFHKKLVIQLEVIFP